MAESKISYNLENGIWVIQISGDIAENFGIERPPSAIKTSQVEIYFSNITTIKSIGIRNWVSWITWLSSNNKLIVFYDCPKLVVDQFNIVFDFLPANGRVDSFFVPFYSESNDEEKHILFKRNRDFDESGNFQIPKVIDSQEEEMTLDVSEKKYFGFLLPKKKR